MTASIQIKHLEAVKYKQQVIHIANKIDLYNWRAYRQNNHSINTVSLQPVHIHNVAIHTENPPDTVYHWEMHKIHTKSAYIT